MVIRQKNNDESVQGCKLWCIFSCLLACVCVGIEKELKLADRQLGNLLQSDAHRRVHFQFNFKVASLSQNLRAIIETFMIMRDSLLKCAVNVSLIP